MKKIDASWVHANVHPRKLDGHKKSFGHVLVIAGSNGKAGASILCARAALHSGCGMVTAFIPQEAVEPLLGESPEIMYIVNKEIAEVARLQAEKKEAAAKIIQNKRDTITLGMAWTVYIEARRKRWSDWSIRDHENIALPGGVEKLRGAGLTEAAPLASLLNVRLSDLTGIRIAEWLARIALRSCSFTITWSFISSSMISEFSYILLKTR